MSRLTILGDDLFARTLCGKLRSRIATIFPATGTLVTLPGIHLTQRTAYLDWLEDRRRREGLPPFSKEERSLAWWGAVDLIVDEAEIVLIRPDPENMRLAYKADEVLQERVPKHRIKFLHVLHPKVREAIKKRGECWRITPLPTTREQMKEMIRALRVSICGREIYYYNAASGTRFLTCQEFAGLGELDELGAAVPPSGDPGAFVTSQCDGLSGTGLLYG